jgi:hypothetical protein
VKPDGAPRNRKVSIHNMYRRRLRKLSRALDQYLQLAEAKLDKAQSGNIHNRAEIEYLVAKGMELAVLLPSEQERADRSSPGNGSPGTPQRAAGETETPSPGANEFFKGLTNEEWEEMKRAFNKDA